jgi:hypothetical protein
MHDTVDETSGHFDAPYICTSQHRVAAVLHEIENDLLNLARLYRHHGQM